MTEGEWVNITKTFTESGAIVKWNWAGLFLVVLGLLMAFGLGVFAGYRWGKATNEKGAHG